MRYFEESVITTKNIHEKTLTLREIVSIYAQDDPPLARDSDHKITEITSVAYFNMRSVLEGNAGRPLADIIKNDTFHDIPYDGTLTLYQRQLKKSEEASAEEGTT